MLTRSRFALPVVASLCLLLGFAAAVQARDLRTTAPGREGLSAQRLERITAHMNQAVADGIMVGGLGMIARNGKIVYQQSYGLRVREAGTPMTEDTIFRIYSMSKPITAVALMMLYEEGRFFLNDPVARYLPELADLALAVSTADSGAGAVTDGTTSRGVVSGDESRIGETRKPRRQPTIRDLLRHTAGFTYGVFGDTEVDRRYREAGLLEQATMAEAIAELGKIPLQYEPGSRFHYSVSVDVQGRLVEVISGMRFGEFLEQRLFGPLGMRDTAFVVPAAKAERFAKLYSPEGTDISLNSMWQRNDSTRLVPADPSLDEGYREGSTFESGGGGLVSTAEDYMRFCLMLLNGGESGGVRFLSPKTVELMTTDHLGELPMGMGMTGMGFGLGFAVVLDLGETGELGSVGEYNWGGAAGTRFWIDPRESLIGLFMVQSIPHQTRLAKEFRILTYQALVE
jgi:CubicO group peptidase (beta-lactamase class C family)